MVVSAILKGIPCLVAGLPRQVRAATEFIRGALGPNGVVDYPIDVFAPSDSNRPYKFQRHQLAIIQSAPIGHYQVNPHSAWSSLLLGTCFCEGFIVRGCERLLSLSYFSCLLCSVLQLPAVWTRSSSKYCTVVSVEFLGWWMRRLETVNDGAWVLLLTESDDPVLAAQLVMRSPKALNVTIGFGSLRNTGPDMAKLEKVAEMMLVPAIKEANSLVCISWALRCTYCTGQPFSEIEACADQS